MIFKSIHIGVLVRILILIIVIGGSTYFILESLYLEVAVSLIVFLIITYEFFRFLIRRFEIIEDFFKTIEYGDFTRRYLEKNKARDIQFLYRGFNTVNEAIGNINSQKETQYLYLQKILELIETGIIAYNTKSGQILWINEYFQDSLGLPSFKNISFVKNRNKEVYQLLFKRFYSEASSLEITIQNETINVLVSNTIFKVKEKTFKLIVLHNIEETINKTESDAWKKLLSVMTHEIMNSITPISSLANTLKLQVEMHHKNPDKNNLDIPDLNIGLSSIEKRSEGLLKFAKTYRSLSKVNNINKEKIYVSELFNQLQNLLQQTKKNKINLDFHLLDSNLTVEADTYLLEQVIINIVINSIKACESISDPKIKVSAYKKSDDQVIISIADNGSGISNEIKDRVFTPFFTTKKEGSGIGLSLSKQIMTLHGGKIYITSELNKGTIVNLIFKNS